ncbi:MAG: fumarylacetoacetate hydrolase family protein [Alphaproteobacteria bacterium]|nr:fumarylacetoacetate hydrolase family protein [Alphaproteobacteria bacterium]
MPDATIWRQYPILPDDGTAGTLVGRVWRPAHDGTPAGPSVVAVRSKGVIDITRTAPTTSALLNAPEAVARVRAADGETLGSLDEIVANTVAERRDESRPWLLAPIDLQAVKAAGVTFAVSLLERLIEEQAKGDPARAEGVRQELSAAVGADIARVKPGSPQAEQLKQALVGKGLWSPYLEVGIGPHAEIFTKAPPMASVGYGVDVGIRADSDWNNPEPEVVLVVNAQGDIVGATLGNDVNLRDMEGRSALLLGKAKDNNASSAVGPFIRLFDASFSLDDVRKAEVQLEVLGPDQFHLRGKSDLGQISRDPVELVRQAMGQHHQYPDGMVLYTGTLFAPSQPRTPGGAGFTHVLGDYVVIRSPKLGTLMNRVNRCDAIAPWTFGTGALMRNLAARGML